MITPKIADSLLNTDLGSFPLVDLENFIIHYLKKEDRYEFDLGIAYDNDGNFLKKLENYVVKNGCQIKNDNDFNVIHAQNEYDYYLKVLRRLVSVNLFMDRICECIAKVLNPEMAAIEDKMDSLYQAGEKSDLFKEEMPHYSKQLQTLKDYEESLKLFDEQVMNFYNLRLEGDLLNSNHNAKTRAYPVCIHLHECVSTIGFCII